MRKPASPSSSRPSSFTQRLWIAILLTAVAVAVLQLSIFHRHQHLQRQDANNGGGVRSHIPSVARQGPTSKGSSLAESKADFLALPKAAVGARTKKRDDGAAVPPDRGPPSHNDNNNNNEQHHPQQQQPPPPPQGKPSEPTQTPPNYHVVFSSSCTDQQDWESWVLFYHAWKVGQPGTVTRIASGCGPERAAALREQHDRFVAQLSSRFRLHLTPDFSRLHLEHGKYPYKYMNKPYGLRHWMENVLQIDNVTAADQSPYKDDVVIVMDPDMVLLRPLVHDWRGRDDVVWSLHGPNEKLAEEDKVVRRGHPIAQHDGYLTSEWMKFQPSYPNGTQLERPKNWGDGTVHYNSGPPYMAVVSDMYKLAVRWTVWAPLVLEIHPQLFAEMHGLIWAAVELNMPFALAKSFVVSEPAARSREGWSHVDAVDDKDVCAYNGPHRPLPAALHYCKRYMLGEWFFSKYRLKKNILSCDKGLIMLPPPNVHELDYAVPPPRDDGKPSGEARSAVEPTQAKREAYMLCHIMTAVNEAVRRYKQLACPEGGGNLNETYSVHTDPSAY